MIQNDGSRANVEVFWDRFCALTGERRSQFEQACNGFYTREFHRCRISTGDNQLAREAIRRAREQAEFVILATNPLFPMDGQLTRLSWIGLKAEDFDLITAYEGECYCKPNPLYYQHICERFGVMPRQCLMIGNDENEDMFAATRAGLQGYLVTDCVLKSEAHPWRGPQGTFAQMVDMLAGI